MDIKHEINHKLFLQREENIHHTSYTSEFGMYKAIAAGNLELVKELAKKFPGIDCGSCGAPSCRALAEDIARGEAKETDCIHVLWRNLHTIMGMMTEMDKSSSVFGETGKKEE